MTKDKQDDKPSEESKQSLRDKIRSIEALLKTTGLKDELRFALDAELADAQSAFIKLLTEPWWAYANREELAKIQSFALDEEDESCERSSDEEKITFLGRDEKPDPKKVYEQWKARQDEYYAKEQRKVRERRLRRRAETLFAQSGLYQHLLAPFVRIAELEEQAEPKLTPNEIWDDGDE